MKMLRFLKSSLIACAVFALAGFAEKVCAQATLVPVTVSVSLQEFNTMMSAGVIPVLQATPTHYTGYGSSTVIGPPGTGTGTDPDPWPPIDPPPCEEQMTDEIAQQMQALANQYCDDMLICLQGSDCNFYMYIFRPNSPDCIFNVAMPYQPTLAAYAL